MQKILVLFGAVFFLLLSTLQAHDGMTYVAGMTGVECNDCKKKIARKIGKLKGVKTIRIVKKGENFHTLYVDTDGKHPITKQQAIAALGDDVGHYTITSWKATHSH